MTCDNCGKYRVKLMRVKQIHHSEIPRNQITEEWWCAECVGAHFLGPVLARFEERTML